MNLANKDNIKSKAIDSSAHQIRNHLHGIIGSLSLLNSENLNMDQKRYLETAKQSAIAILDVLNKTSATTESNLPEIADSNKISNVLVIDDSKIGLMIAKKQLEGRGLDVSTVSSGEEALKVLKDNFFNVILLDCHLPGIDGFETARLIRDMESTKKERSYIIALTADVSNETRINCIKSGMDEYLTKPVNFKELINSIIKVSNLYYSKASAF